METSPTYALRFLDGIPFHEIHRATVEAFEDYLLDMSYMTEEALRRRATKNGVDLSCSPGAFHEGRLVGLTLVGLGIHGGVPTAFDACTGIVKAHRGCGLAGRLFDLARPALARRGVRQFVLEVLQENKAAIKAYERTGFRISRPWDCFQLEAPARLVDAGRWAIRSVSVEALDAFAGELDWQPSWENGFDAIRAVPGDVRLAGAFEDGTCVGVAAWHPFFRWLMLLAVKRSHRGRGIGSALLAHALAGAGSEGRPLRANNVDPGDAALVGLLERAGFVRFTGQYEMVCDLS